MMGNQDGGTWSDGKWSIPAKTSNVEYPGSYYSTPPSAPPAYSTATPSNESLYPKIHAPAQPGYPPQGPYSPQGQYPPQGQYSPQGHYSPQGQHPPQGPYPSQGSYPSQGPYPATPAGGYTSWPSGANFQYGPPAQDRASYSPYTSEHSPYTQPAPPGGYTAAPAPPHYQSAAPAASPYSLPPSPGYQSMPSFSQSGNPYANVPGSYGVPSAPPGVQRLAQHDSFRLGGSGRNDDLFRTQSMGGSPFRTDSAPLGGLSPYDQGGPPPFVRMDSGPVPRPPPYSHSMSLQPPSYHSGGGEDQYIAGAANSLGRSNSNLAMVPLAPPLGHATPPTLLHGTLKVRIIQAKRVPNMDGLTQKLSSVTSSLSITQKASVHSDPYVTVVLANARVARTAVIYNNADPKWDEHFSIPVAHPVHHIVFTLRDQDVIGTDHIGDVKIPVERVLNGGVVNGWFDVITPQGKVTKKQAQLELTASYIPVEEDSVYMQGIAGGDSHAVPQTYFPCRKGCRLTLYQDTHIYDHTIPSIRLDGGQVYEARRCWEDLCAAIYNAQHLIYIAGWSVYDKVRLIRDRSRPVAQGGDLTLGELLKEKAKRGVRVLLLIWDDKTSHDLSFIKTDGVMNTHDEETKKYFKGTGVRCVLAARYGATKMSWFKQKVVGTLYSHHQKMTIVDSGPPEQRTLTSFIGGLDLTGGRWDTPSHCLFGSLENEHKGDFRNKSWPWAPDSGGPRQPWHDWHCKIEGHAAYDVLKNFEQRWRKATKTHDEELLDIDRCTGLVAPLNKAPLSGDPALFITNEYDAETWQVQIFRSIDSASVKGFPLTAEEVTREFLVWGKSVAIDISIQMAYIKAIRCAQHFIYVENQYFLGSSYNWPDYKTAGANHLIPMELTLKICSKIKEQKRFAVYIVIPMWPEGIPDGGPVQEILYFQTQTMKMMYRLIADTLKEYGPPDRKPTDYLNFYCLGNRETKKPGEPEPRKPPASSSNQAKSQRSRRMMIYVHSKGMIVDDEYVISGSANINQRSMDGSRDTEIAMGGYQPHHTWLARNNRPRGQVYGYRMSLWAEHLENLELAFEEPESLECVQRVNAMADSNWQQYAAPEVTDLRGHLIRYPLKIEDDGTIRTLPGFETFPDVGGKVMGSNQEQLPDDLTA